MILYKLLKYTRINEASDLHLSTNNLPMVRLDGELIKVPGSRIVTNTDMATYAKEVMDNLQYSKFTKEKQLDLSIIIPEDQSRFRVNFFYTNIGISAVFRIINDVIPDIKDLLLPEILYDICSYQKGLVLITGPAGSGKSTTLASMVNHINKKYKKKVITIEDPIEFLYHNENCLIEQREVGSSALSFPLALKSSLREDPDIILIGEMRDTETVKLALTAAETGHLVFSTLHTNSASESINRILDIFSGNQQNSVRGLLSTSLQAIVSQRLFKKKHDKGRYGAYEILINNNSIKTLIRDNKIEQITSIMEISSQEGMLTMKDSIEKLIKNDIITKEDGESYLHSI